MLQEYNEVNAAIRLIGNLIADLHASNHPGHKVTVIVGRARLI